MLRWQDRYVKFPQIGTVVIEDNVEIGANSCVDRGALGETRIGEGTKIDNLVQIAHNVQIGKRVVIAAQTGISGSTVIEDDCVIGGQVGMGDHARVQAVPSSVLRPVSCRARSFVPASGGARLCSRLTNTNGRTHI